MNYVSKQNNALKRQQENTGIERIIKGKYRNIYDGDNDSDSDYDTD